ncbi:TetR/AcrR family transcriptional regulator [Mycobacterium sp. 1274756.6]|uniref:TetR/AcrR family transcriptional regulator n=1 Tax=Mycobacterium sp. 1274756.6 TaxID=1834076 RepID=UPI000800F0EA|nr:TetR/AcrR family transcriptional regulator [Mycobacterium sp. 1274756.6]OBJ69444.1 hypothetical protein A5643_12140 [Mycobacterium sp. 1274756.6]
MPAPPAKPRPKRGRPPIANLEEQRREQIIAAAVSVFADNGYEATTMSDIARHAGIGQGTLYRYVASKRELLDLVFDYSVEEILGEVRPALLAEQPVTDVADALARFDAAWAAVLTTIDQRPALASLVLVEASAMDEELKLRALGLEAGVARMAAGVFEEARDAGFLRSGADPQVLGLLVTKLVIPAGLREVMGGADAARRDRYRAALTDFLRHGVFTDGPTR